MGGAVGNAVVGNAVVGKEVGEALGYAVVGKEVGEALGNADAVGTAEGDGVGAVAKVTNKLNLNNVILKIKYQ